MSDIPTYTDEMPAPVPTGGPSMHDLVAADMAERKAHGLRKYGTVLQAGNGRPALKDAYEEGLDLVVYLRQAIEEQKAEGRPHREALIGDVHRALGEGVHHWHFVGDTYCGRVTEKLLAAGWRHPAITDRDTPPPPVEINTPGVRQEISNVLRDVLDHHCPDEVATEATARVYVVLNRASAGEIR